MLVALKHCLCPSEHLRGLELKGLYKAACKPPKSGNIETWLDKFETTVVYVKASRVVAVLDFLRAIEGISEASRIFSLDCVCNLVSKKLNEHECDVRELISAYREHLHNEERIMKALGLTAELHGV